MNVKKIFVTSSVLALATVFSVNCASAGKDIGINGNGNGQKNFKKAKNIIVMISDGAGYNTHLATEYWHGKKQPYDNPRFAKYSVSISSSSGSRADTSECGPVLNERARGVVRVSVYTRV